MTPTADSPWLVCFAFEDEARPFRKQARGQPGLNLLITGMGPRNAERALESALAGARPTFVLSSGLAGGLNPEWPVGTVVFDVTDAPQLAPQLAAAGGRAGRFHTVDRVVVTAAEKQRLRAATGADVVDMESAAILGVGRRHGVPAVIVRIISDPASEDLPLDFNAYLTPDRRWDYARLIPSLLGSPRLLRRVLRFNRQARSTARRLADFLTHWGQV